MKTRRQQDGAPAAAESVASKRVFIFNDKSYDTYQEMVNAKRQRNRDMLVTSGLLEAKAAVDNAVLQEKRAAATARGIKRSKAPKGPPPPRRKSSRLAGVTAPGIYVESELAGRFEIAGGTITGASFTPEPEKPEFYNNRVNDGSDLTVAEAVNLTGSKWVNEGSVVAAEHFMKRTLPGIIKDLPVASSPSKKKGSPTSVAKGPGAAATINSKNLQRHLDDLSLDDPETCVAKVCPERIYSVACHPSPDKIIACAGDKWGNLGIWNVDQYGVSADSATDGVHLFKPHSRPVSSLAWDHSGTSLLTASYDGTVRAFDANKQEVFEEIFATYDDDKVFKDKVGYGTDHGYNS